MKTLIKSFVLICIFGSLAISQTKAPVKKVVSSKITTNPKTGKVVKTITTITTQDVVLEPGKSISQAPVKQKQNIPAPKKVVKAGTVAKTVKPKKVQTTPKKVITEKVVVKTEEEPKIEITTPKETENTVIEKAIVEKPIVETKPVEKPVAKSNDKLPSKIYKEKNKSGISLSNLYFGVRGGLNSNGMENGVNINQAPPTPTDAYKLGFNAGLLLNIGFSKHLSLQPEINYSQQGYKVTDGPNYTALSTQAINIPLLLKLSIGSKATKLFFTGGPYVGYLLDRKLTTKSLDFKYTANIDLSSGQNFNRIDYGASAGAGLQFDLGGTLLEIEGRYLHGFADDKNYALDTKYYLVGSGRNRVASGNISLLFPLGKK